MPVARTAIFLAAATSVALAAGLVGCSAPAQEGDAGSWTVLTYEIADTDLEP